MTLPVKLTEICRLLIACNDELEECYDPSVPHGLSINLMMCL